MNNKEETYYSAFVDSILSLPPSTRSFVLNAASFNAKDQNPYEWLWQAYCNETLNECYLHNLLDQHNLAID